MSPWRTTAATTYGTRDDCKSSPECPRLPPSTPPSSSRRHHSVFLVSACASPSLTPCWCWSIGCTLLVSSTPRLLSIHMSLHFLLTLSSLRLQSLSTTSSPADPSSLATSLA